MKRLIGPTLMSTAASAVAAGTTLVIAWGLGAAAFGRFTVILSIALIVTVAMLLSLNYVVLQEVPRAEATDRPGIVTTALAATVVWSFAVLVIGVVAGPALAAALGVDREATLLGLLLAIAMSVHQLTDGLLRGLGRYALVAALKLAVAAGYLATVGYLLVVREVADPDTYLWILIGTTALFAVVAGVYLPVGRHAWSRPLARTLYRHGAYVTAIAAVTAVLFGVDVLMLNAWSNPTDVGVYSIYNGFPKRLLGVVFTEGIGLALLPALATMDKPRLMRRIGVLAPAVGAAAAVLSFAASAVFLLLLRADYPYSLGLMLLAALGIGVHTAFNLYFFALSMDGVRGAKVFLACLLLGTPVALAGQAVLIATGGVVGGLVAFAVTNAVLVAVVVVAVRRAYLPAAADPVPVPEEAAR